MGYLCIGFCYNNIATRNTGNIWTAEATKWITTFWALWVEAYSRQSLLEDSTKHETVPRKRNISFSVIKKKKKAVAGMERHIWMIRNYFILDLPFNTVHFALHFTIQIFISHDLSPQFINTRTQNLDMDFDFLFWVYPCFPNNFLYIYHLTFCSLFVYKCFSCM